LLLKDDSVSDDVPPMSIVNIPKLVVQQSLTNRSAVFEVYIEPRQLKT